MFEENTIKTYMIKLPTATAAQQGLPTATAAQQGGDGSTTTTKQ